MKRSFPSRRQLRAGRHGFTLLEVLTALALSLLLIAAVYSGLNLYWKYSISGQDEVAQAQLARVLLRKIELDLRSVIYHASSADEGMSTGGTSSGSGSGTGGGGSAGSSGSGTGGGTGGGSGGSNSSSSSSNSSSGSSTTTSSSTTSTSPDDAVTSSNTGLYGNGTTLMMHVSKPARVVGTSLVNGAASPTRTSDLVTVAYFLGGTTTGALQSAVSSPGLARLEGDRLAMQLADEESNLAALAAQTELLAPEVIALQFQYFDGLEWRSDWDSSALGGLPRAIEILIELQAPHNSGMKSLGGSQSPSVYRLVVALPAAKPVDTSQTP